MTAAGEKRIGLRFGLRFVLTGIGWLAEGMGRIAIPLFPTRTAKPVANPVEVAFRSLNDSMRLVLRQIDETSAEVIRDER